MRFNPDIFRSYDIRGIYGVDFDDEFAYKLGRAFVDTLGAEKIVVAHDMRNTSSVLAQRVIEGVRKMGCNIINLGVTTTPLFYFGVASEKADGGIMVTASHLGNEYNGFKLAGRGAEIIGGQGRHFSALKTAVQKTGAEPLLPRGTVGRKNLIDRHTKEIIRISGIKPGQLTSSVKLDANQIAVDELGSILLELDVPVNYSRPDVVFILDADGDRIQAADKEGTIIRGDLLGGIIARAYFAGKGIAHDVKFSHLVLDYLRQHSITPVCAKTGHAFIKQAMKEGGLDFGAEFSGHYMFKAFNYAESPALMMLLILYLLELTKTDLKTLVRPMDLWANSGLMEYSLSDLANPLPKAISAIKETYRGGIVNEMDGFDIRYQDWRMLIRPSSTHPAVVCIVEAKTKDLLDKKVRELQSFLL